MGSEKIVAMKLSLPCKLSLEATHKGLQPECISKCNCICKTMCPLSTPFNTTSERWTGSVQACGPWSPARLSKSSSRCTHYHQSQTTKRRYERLLLLS